MGPPSSGGVAIVQIMGMLQNFPSSDLQPGSLSGAHLYLEASRLAYADRSKYMADTDFVQVPLNELLSREYNDARRKLVTDRASMELRPGAIPGYTPWVDRDADKRTELLTRALGVDEPTVARLAFLLV